MCRHNYSNKYKHVPMVIMILCMYIIMHVYMLVYNTNTFLMYMGVDTCIINYTYLFLDDGDIGEDEETVSLSQ